QQRPGIVQPQANARMPPQTVEERQIRTLIGLLQHSIKIPYRLMGMDQKNEIELAQVRTPLKQSSFIMPRVKDSFPDRRGVFLTLVRCPRMQVRPSVISLSHTRNFDE